MTVGMWEVIPVMMSVVGSRSDHQERRFGDRRKEGEQAVGASRSNPVLSERGKSDRASGSEEDCRGEGERHWKLLVWDQDGSCHEGTTPCVIETTLFVESTWMAPIGSDVTISLVPGEEDAVGQELIQGTVVWHCPQDDEFKNKAGFGVRLHPQSADTSSPDLSARLEGGPLKLICGNVKPVGRGREESDGYQRMTVGRLITV